jgi:hypothetical protein
LRFNMRRLMQISMILWRFLFDVRRIGGKISIERILDSMYRIGKCRRDQRINESISRAMDFVLESFILLFFVRVFQKPVFQHIM